MKTFVVALLAAGAAAAAGNAQGQLAYPTALSRYRPAYPAHVPHTHDVDCADGSCATARRSSAPSLSVGVNHHRGCLPGECESDMCGVACESGVCGHDHTASVGHTAECADGVCDHAPGPRRGHVCTGEDCAHGTTGSHTPSTVAGVSTMRRPAPTSRLRPVPRIGSWPAVVPPIDRRFEADPTFDARPTFDLRTAPALSPRPARTMQYQDGFGSDRGLFNERF